MIRMGLGGESDGCGSFDKNGPAAVASFFFATGDAGDGRVRIFLIFFVVCACAVKGCFGKVESYFVKFQIDGAISCENQPGSAGTFSKARKDPRGIFLPVWLPGSRCPR